MGKKNENNKKATPQKERKALKDKQNAGIVQRIEEILEDKQLSINKFANEVRLSQRTLNRQLNECATPVDLKTILAILGLFPTYNVEWLLWGKEPKIKEATEELTDGMDLNEPAKDYGRITNNAIPIYNPLIDAVNPLDIDNSEERTAYKHIALPSKSSKEFVVITSFSKISFTNITELSYVHLERMNNWVDTIFYKQIYFIELVDGQSLFAEIQRSKQKGNIRLICKKPNPMMDDIPVSQVKNVSRIIGVYDQIS